MYIVHGISTLCISHRGHGGCLHHVLCSVQSHAWVTLECSLWHITKYENLRGMILVLKIGSFYFVPKTQFARKSIEEKITHIFN